MPDRAGVFCSVAIRGAVAAERFTALLTGAQVDPLSPDLHAFVTLLAFGPFDCFYGLHMRTQPGLHGSEFLSYSFSTWCTKAIAIEPSPTAEATRFMLVARTSPIESRGTSAGGAFKNASSSSFLFFVSRRQTVPV